MTGALPPGRSSGVLLHPTSLPGGAIGTLGTRAHAFVDWLADAGQRVWQILPLVAVDEGGSPYNGLSAFAGNPLLIDPRLLAAEGLLEADAMPGEQEDARVHYAELTPRRAALLATAHDAFREGAAPDLRQPFERFRQREKGWLRDYALFRALRAAHEGRSWREWEPALRDREAAAMERFAADRARDVERYEFQQFLFARQWEALHEHARRRGISIVGDLPIFVAHDSADVWANRDLFELDAAGLPTVVSGVPPDYFSETGQLWGNPLYRWEVLREDGYGWWVERFRRTLAQVDVVRIDHFRGFEAYWEVPAGEETAMNGRWVAGPGRDLFDRLAAELGPLPLIAEDLGLITPEVEALRDSLGFPGMRVLQFAFDGEAHNPHLPRNYPEHAVAYTGTHDNDTAVGWWRAASREEHERALPWLGPGQHELNWALMEVVARSAARLVVFPAQDLLGLGTEARMNTPGTAAENWSWRLRSGDLSSSLMLRLREMTVRSGRHSSEFLADESRERWGSS